jgi:lipoyl-dependent peroxiredoxin
MIRKARAVWRGAGRGGSGELSTESGVLAKTPIRSEVDSRTRKGPIPKS